MPRSIKSSQSQASVDSFHTVRSHIMESPTFNHVNQVAYPNLTNHGNRSSYGSYTTNPRVSYTENSATTITTPQSREEPSVEEAIKSKQTAPSETERTKAPRWQRILKIILLCLLLLLLLYLFICSLDLLSRSFQLLGGQTAGNTFRDSKTLSNPVAGLVIGVLATVMLQSSSTTTSILVSLVSTQVVPIRVAIPIVMGANIGTSVTSTFVSLGHSGDRQELQRAFAGATVHDMFNWLCVLILLPLEQATGYLYHLTGAMVSLNSGNSSDVKPPKLLEVITDPLTDLLVQLDKGAISDVATGKLGANDTFDIVKRNCSGEPCFHAFVRSYLSNTEIGGIILMIALIGLIACLTCIVKVLNKLLHGTLSNTIHNYINSDLPRPFGFLTGYAAMVAGAIITILVQSSSIVTSTLTPLVGIGVLALERMFPVTLGANVGTTFTGILAALASPNIHVALHIALCHLMFNISGILIFYPIPFMRKIPLSLARCLGETTATYRWFPIAYIIVAFVAFPGGVFALSLAGLVPMLCVLVPFIVFVLLIIAINIVQDRWPERLPTKLRNWHFLPLCMRSLDPIDNIFTYIWNFIKSSCCCKLCYRRKIAPSKDSVEMKSVH